MQSSDRCLIFQIDLKHFIAVTVKYGTRLKTMQYFCSKCNTILRELQQDLTKYHSIESCPECGTFLSESLGKRPVTSRMVKPVLFQQASTIPKMTFDISKIDDVIQFLRTDQRVAIVGSSSQKLIERLCVRAQLSKRYGGLDSSVILVDGANSSEPYLGISLARQYGMPVEDVLSKIITARAFTIHQLASLIINELPKIIQKYKSKFIVISDILGMFSDPYIDSREAQTILQEIVKSISNLSECLVVVSISRQTKFDYIINDMCDRIIRISKKDNRICFTIDGKEPVFAKESELEVVVR